MKIVIPTGQLNAQIFLEILEWGEIKHESESFWLSLGHIGAQSLPWLPLCAGYRARLTWALPQGGQGIVELRIRESPAETPLPVFEIATEGGSVFRHVNPTTCLYIAAQARPELQYLVQSHRLKGLELFGFHTPALQRALLERVHAAGPRHRFQQALQPIPATPATMTPAPGAGFIPARPPASSGPFQFAPPPQTQQPQPLFPHARFGLTPPHAPHATHAPYPHAQQQLPQPHAPHNEVYLPPYRTTDQRTTIPASLSLQLALARPQTQPLPSLFSSLPQPVAQKEESGGAPAAPGTAEPSPSAARPARHVGKGMGLLVAGGGGSVPEIPAAPTTGLDGNGRGQGEGGSSRSMSLAASECSKPQRGSDLSVATMSSGQQDRGGERVRGRTGEDPDRPGIVALTVDRGPASSKGPVPSTSQAGSKLQGRGAAATAAATGHGKRPRPPSNATTPSPHPTHPQPAAAEPSLGAAVTAATGSQRQPSRDRPRPATSTLVGRGRGRRTSASPTDLPGGQGAGPLLSAAVAGRGRSRRASFTGGAGAGGPPPPLPPSMQQEPSMTLNAREAELLASLLSDTGPEAETPPVTAEVQAQAQLQQILTSPQLQPHGSASDQLRALALGGLNLNTASPTLTFQQQQVQAPQTHSPQSPGTMPVHPPPRFGSPPIRPTTHITTRSAAHAAAANAATTIPGSPTGTLQLGPAAALFPSPPGPRPSLAAGGLLASSSPGRERRERPSPGGPAAALQALLMPPSPAGTFGGAGAGPSTAGMHVNPSKRGFTAFTVFGLEMRVKVREENPAAGPKDVEKKVGQLWSQLTERDKAKYQTAAQLMKAGRSLHEVIPQLDTLHAQAQQAIATERASKEAAQAEAQAQAQIRSREYALESRPAVTAATDAALLELDVPEDPLLLLQDRADELMLPPSGSVSAGPGTGGGGTPRFFNNVTPPQATPLLTNNGDNSSPLLMGGPFELPSRPTSRVAHALGLNGNGKNGNGNGSVHGGARFPGAGGN